MKKGFTLIELLVTISIIGLLSAEVARQLGPLVAEAGKALSRQLGARVD